MKPSFKPAVERWKTQFVIDRKLEARIATPRVLHDRLMVIDRQTVWDISQSFNGLAARSPASITKTEAEPAALKLAAYEDFWTKAAIV